MMSRGAATEQWAKNWSESHLSLLRSSVKSGILTQGSQTRLGLSAVRCSAAGSARPPSSFLYRHHGGCILRIDPVPTKRSVAFVFLHVHFGWLVSVDFPVLFRQLADLAHDKLTNLFVSSHMIFFGNELGHVQQLSEMNSNLVAAKPVSQHLFGQVIAQARDKYRKDLGVRLFYEPADTRLWPQEGIRV